jgi:hypothetical protein
MVAGNRLQVLTMRLEQIPIDSLFIEEEFQRELKQKKVNDILKDFSELKVNPVKVHKESDGMYSVLDGQNTTHALRIKHYTHAPCIVFEGLTKETKAHLFRTQDENKTRLTPYDRYKAGIVESDPKSLILKATLERADYPRGKIKALATIRELTSIFDERTMVGALRLVSLCWGKDALSMRAEMFSGMAELLRFCETHGYDFPFAKFVDRMSRVPPADVFRVFAKEYPNVRQAHNIASVDVREAMRKVLTHMYNHNLRAERIPNE